MKTPQFSFTVPVRELREALPELRKIAKTNSSLPILGCVLVEREHGVTRFTTTDLDLRLTFTVPSDLPEPASDLGKQLLERRSEREDGAVCVPIKDLTNAVKNADKAADVTFSATHLTYPFGGNTASIDITQDAPLDPAEFPSRTDLSGTAIPIPEKAKQAMIAALPNATDDESRYVLLSVFLDCEKQTVVATDGKSISAFKTPLPQVGQLIVPKDAVRALSGRISKSSWSILVGDAAIEIHAGSLSQWRLHTKLIDANYPRWQQVIPDHDKSQLAIPLTLFSRSEITELLKRLPRATVGQNGSKNEHDPVRLDVEGSVLRFSVGGSSFTVTIPGKHDKRFITANRRFWQRAVDLGATELRIKDEMSPVIAHDRNGMTFVFMPVRMAT